jgi:hypothetical protein
MGGEKEVRHAVGDVFLKAQSFVYWHTYWHGQMKYHEIVAMRFQTSFLNGFGFSTTVAGSGFYL